MDGDGWMDVTDGWMDDPRWMDGCLSSSGGGGGGGVGLIKDA